MTLNYYFKIKIKKFFIKYELIKILIIYNYFIYIFYYFIINGY